MSQIGPESVLGRGDRRPAEGSDLPKGTATLSWSVTAVACDCVGDDGDESLSVRSTLTVVVAWKGWRLRTTL